MPIKADTPMTSTYAPELDTTPVLVPSGAAYYKSLNAILRWIVELGRCDICFEVSMLSSYLAHSREGHLAQLFHIFAHLKKYNNAEIIYEPTDPVIDEAAFEAKDRTLSEFGHIDGRE